MVSNLRFWLACWLAAALLVVESAGAQPGDCEPELVTTMGTLGRANSVVVREGIAYVGTWFEHFSTYDVSDPAQPVLVGRVPLPYAAFSMTLDGDRVLGSSGDDGVWVMDISDLAQPAISGLVDVASTGGRNVWGITTVDNTLYVANDQEGLVMFDIANPANPVALGTWTLFAQAYDVEVIRTTHTGTGEDRLIAYVAYGFDDLAVVDVTDPAMPRLLIRRETGREARSVIARDGYLYAGDDGRGLNIFDISVPIAPQRRGIIEPPEGGYGLDYRDGLIFTADGSFGWQIIDVSDPFCPRVLFDAGRIAGGSVGSVAVSGGHAWVDHSSQGLMVYRVEGCQPQPCPVDLNGDCSIDIFDFMAFETWFASGDPRADFDGDGRLTFHDFLSFFNAFDIGC
jgi:hypothetical protein